MRVIFTQVGQERRGRESELEHRLRAKVAGIVHQASPSSQPEWVEEAETPVWSYE